MFFAFFTRCRSIQSSTFKIRPARFEPGSSWILKLSLCITLLLLLLMMDNLSRIRPRLQLLCTFKTLQTRFYFFLSFILSLLFFLFFLSYLLFSFFLSFFFFSFFLALITISALFTKLFTSKCIF